MHMLRGKGNYVNPKWVGQGWMRDKAVSSHVTTTVDAP